MIDYYKILGVSKTATFDQIKKAYRDLAKDLHPDAGGDPKMFKALAQAYEVLSDPAKRSIFDSGKDPAKRGPSIKDQAERQIIEIYNQMLNKELQIDRKAELRDAYGALQSGDKILFIKELENVMDHDIDKLRLDGEEYKKAIGFYQKKLGSIEKKSDGQNIFDAFMLDNIKAITGQRTRVAETIRICRKSIEILKDYQDTKKERKMFKHPFTYAATAAY